MLGKGLWDKGTSEVLKGGSLWDEGGSGQQLLEMHGPQQSRPREGNSDHNPRASVKSCNPSKDCRVPVSPGLGLRAQPSPWVLGLWEQENRKRLATQGGLLEGSSDRKDLTSSLLFLPRRLAVTPLWFVGPREHLHYITPDTTAPKM